MNGPALRGGLLALLAAALFGLSTPLVQRAGAGCGPWVTAALLYAGAALLGALSRRPREREARVARGDLPRLVAMAVFGAALGPAALAWGLQRSSATAASLLLTLEAVFTALLAAALYREHLDRRVRVALALLTVGGGVLVLGTGPAGGQGVVGLLAVGAATLAWGLDNTLSRGLAERDPGQVVAVKAGLGVLLSSAAAAAAGEALPPLPVAAALLALGATGYGLSLRFYLLAQRAFGAARTGSVFAFAPFLGALAALALGDRAGSVAMAVGGGLMLAGVALHLAEAHAHEHAHEALDHEHAHRHDDGHHDHTHDPMPEGEHSHRHHHAPTRHSHPHVPDLHHQHEH